MKNIAKTKYNFFKVIYNVIPVNIVIIDINERGGIKMIKFLAKIAEKYAKSTNSACAVLFFLHQPKMPASLIKKD